jgi:hypothetical protein
MQIFEIDPQYLRNIRSSHFLTRQEARIDCSAHVLQRLVVRSKFRQQAYLAHSFLSLFSYIIYLAHLVGSKQWRGPILLLELA